MSTILQEMLGVRSLLAMPLVQAPSPDDIIEELEAVYQDVTNVGNNTGQAWQTQTYNLTTIIGTREYQLDPGKILDFYKALTVTTVPADTSTPEYPLEFTEIDHLPQEWGWLSQNQGSLLWTSHSSQLMAFYRKIGTLSEEIWCEMRPTPAKVESYKILYQVGNWWEAAFGLTGTAFNLPNKEFRFHFRALAARNLLPKTRWSMGDDSGKMAIVKESLDRRIKMGEKTLEDHLATLDNADLTYLDSYADTVDPYTVPIRYR